MSHNCDRIATKKLLGRNCHKIETELWKVFCREEIVTKLLQNCEKFFVMEELSQNCDRIAKSFLSWGRTAALQLRRMSGDHIKSDDGCRQKEKLKPLWNLNIDLIIFFSHSLILCHIVKYRVFYLDANNFSSVSPDIRVKFKEPFFYNKSF